MGAALTAVSEVGHRIRASPATAGLIGLIALVMWVGSTLNSVLPYVGIFVGVVVAFLVGSMYAVASAQTPSLDPVIHLIRDRWLSLLGVYVIMFAVGMAYAIVVLVPFMLLIVMGLITGSVFLIVAGFAMFVPIGLLLAFLYAMFLQFLYPIVAIDHVGAIESVKRVVDLVRTAPLSVAGATVIRLFVQYLPPAIGMIGVGIVFRHRWVSIIDEVREILVEADAQGPDLLTITIETLGWGPFLSIIVLIVILGIVGEILRVVYLTTYYESTGVHQASK